MRLLLVGCGAIGHVIAEAAEKMDAVERLLLYDVINENSERLARRISKSEALPHLSFGDLDAELVVEAASQEAAKMTIPPALESGHDAMILSVGALADKDAQRRCYSAVSSRQSMLVIPSGSIAGVDALRAASVADIESVRLTTVKPPMGLTGVRYLEERGLDVNELEERTVLYVGSASEAVRLFPANVNVAATVSLAGVGFERTKVEIVCDPGTTVNSHRLFAKGAFGEVDTVTRNVPSPDNPRTSYLAALSAVSALNSYIRRIWVGV